MKTFKTLMVLAFASTGLAIAACDGGKDEDNTDNADNAGNADNACNACNACNATGS